MKRQLGAALLLITLILTGGCGGPDKDPLSPPDQKKTTEQSTTQTATPQETKGTSAEKETSAVLPKEEPQQTTESVVTPEAPEEMPVTPQVELDQPQAPRGEPASPSAQIIEAPEAVVTLQIIDETTGALVLQTAVPWTEGMSAWEALVNACADANIIVDHSGRGNAVYVKGINGLYEFDKGPTSGWLYEVNEAQPNVSAGAYVLQSGDSLRWLYRDSF